jgi:hypothetical protein
MQFPADGHDTDVNVAPTEFSAGSTGTCCAVPQVPSAWVTATSCVLVLAGYEPTAVQFPADAHEIEVSLRLSGFSPDRP